MFAEVLVNPKRDRNFYRARCVECLTYFSSFAFRTCIKGPQHFERPFATIRLIQLRPISVLL